MYCLPIDTPTSGEITINKTKIHLLKEKQTADFRKDNLGFIFQEYFLLDSLTIEENIAVPLTLQNKSPKEIETKTQELANLFGITSQTYINCFESIQSTENIIDEIKERQPDIILMDINLNSIIE